METATEAINEFHYRPDSETDSDSGLRYALHQVFALDGVGHEVESSSIRNLCLACAPTAAQQVSPGRMEQVIAVELISKRLHEGKAGIGSVGHCDRDCSVQLDHR